MARTGREALTGAPVPAAALALALGTGAIILGAAILGGRRRDQLERVRRYRDSAPRAARRAGAGDRALSANVVTIGRPRAEVYAFWRDLRNLPSFMENVLRVEERGPGRTAWTIRGPAGTEVELVSEIVEEREGELIAWRSTEDSPLEAAGRVTFRDAPAGRGTVVTAEVAYRPPGGAAGRWMAALFQREPNVQGRRELRRLKMLMETGEIATSRNRRQAG